MSDIIALGELLIDFTSVEGEAHLYQQNAGGAPANVVVQASRLGASCGFIGRVGEDKFGHFLEDNLKAYGVDTKGLSFDTHFATTLAFVEVYENGRHGFSFYRNPGADSMLTYENISEQQLDECKILHFGSLSLTAEPSRSAVLKAIGYAKEKGKLLSYDPNYREQLWTSKRDAVQAMRSALDFCDIIKVSEEELQLLTGCDILIQGIASLLRRGIRIVVVTLGAKGCVVSFKNGLESLPTYDIKVVDTTGAGDSFFGAFLYRLVSCGKTLEELTFQECVSFADYANACGAMTSTKQGAIPAMSTAEEIEYCMRNIKKFS